MQQLFVKRPAKAAPLTGNPALTAPRKYGKILPVAADVQCATVAQLVEQLTRNEQVACSNQVSSSKGEPPKVGLSSRFSGVLLYKNRRTLPGNSGSRMRRRIVPKILLRNLLADPDADAGTDHRDGKGRKAAGSVDAQQAKQKLAHKAAQHAHQDVAA